MQKHGFVCTSCLFQLRSLARRQPARYESTLVRRVNVPASELSLRNFNKAPWYLKRKIRRKIETQLSGGLPKVQGRSSALTPWFEFRDPEIKGLERNKYRQAMALRLFLKKRRSAEEIRKYNAWKDAFRTLTERRSGEGRGNPTTVAQKEEAGLETPSADENQPKTYITGQPTSLDGLPAAYSEARNDLEALLALGDEDAIRARWRSQALGDREASWPQLVLAALAFSPRSACLFIRATWEETICPVYAVNDAVWFLVRRPAVSASAAAATDLCELLVYLLQHARVEGFQLRQYDIWHVLKNVSSDELIYGLYENLVSFNHPLHRHTKLQFAKRFGESAELKGAAFEILESLIQGGELDVNSPHAGALCTTILSPPKRSLEEAYVPRKFVEATEMSESTTKYSERLLELGFNPNMITYSVLIRDLIFRKEVKTALDVLKIMTSQELKPDALLYSFLLHGAKISGSWLPMHMLVQQAFLDDIRDPVVWNELLHTVFTAYLGEVRRQQGRRKGGMPAFPPMLKLYANIFKPGLLRKFIPADLDYLATADLHVSNIWQCEKQAFLLAYRTPSWKSRGLLDPGYDTLTIMILGYVNSLGSPQSIAEFYNHFKRLVDRGDPDAIRLIEKGGTRIYDYILKAMLEFEDYLGMAVGLVNDMLKMSGEGPLKEESIKAITSSRSRSTSPGAATGPRSGTEADDLQVEKLSLSPTTMNTTPAPPPAKENFRHPAPSIHTWSILINGLMFQREADKAEKILDIMEEHGVERSIVPWNTLIAGYANAQNVRKTVKTLQRLEEAGFEGDDWTFKAWGYLVDKEAALSLMEGAEAARTERLRLLLQQTAEQEQASSLNPDQFKAEMEAWEGENAAGGTAAEGWPEDYDQALQNVESTIRDAAR